MPTTPELAETAAEAIRAANHLTIAPGELTAPEEYRVLGELAALAHRLEQLSNQLGRNLTKRLDMGGLRLDSTATYTDPGDAVAVACAALSQAGLMAANLGNIYDNAQNIVGTIADES